MRGSNGFTKPDVTGQRNNSSYVVYEDPAAALNVSEEKWNAIVQENLKKFKDDLDKVKADKIAKSRAV